MMWDDGGVLLEQQVKISYAFGSTTGGEIPAFLRVEEAEKARRFHSTMEDYSETPLVALDELAKAIGVKQILVKDESKRFGLNAFKSLGATYAVVRLLCVKLGISIDEVTFATFERPEVQEQIADMVFVTATDGNHGRGLAWAATKLGCRSVIYMPKGSSQARLQAIIDEGAEATITDMNYDDTVRYAKERADENGWFLVQDTAWEGYEQIPNWIAQGYTTMAFEAIDQMKRLGLERPTHLFLQAGVGSMAGAVLGVFADRFGERCPTTTVVEPEAADCIYRSALRSDGRPEHVVGDLSTIMAGLACGEPNPITWPILRDYASAYVSCDDAVAAHGMRVLGNPLGQDPRVIAGESGAVGIGLLHLMSQREDLKSLREQLGLDASSVILCFNTEGDTDPEHYRQIVWQGKNPSY